MTTPERDMQEQDLAHDPNAAYGGLGPFESGRNVVLALGPVLSLALLLPLLGWAARLDTVTGYPGSSAGQVHHDAGLLFAMGALASVPSVVTAVFAKRWVRVWGIVMTLVCLAVGAIGEWVVVAFSNFTW